MCRRRSGPPPVPLHPSYHPPSPDQQCHPVFKITVQINDSFSIHVWGWKTMHFCKQSFKIFTLIGNIVTLSGASMLYQMHKFPRFWATTTSLPGTHWKQNTGYSTNYRTKQKLNKYMFKCKTTKNQIVSWYFWITGILCKCTLPVHRNSSSRWLFCAVIQYHTDLTENKKNWYDKSCLKGEWHCNSFRIVWNLHCDTDPHSFVSEKYLPSCFIQLKK